MFKRRKVNKLSEIKIHWAIYVQKQSSNHSQKT